MSGSCDATVEHEILLSEYQDDGAPVRKRRVMPRREGPECLLTGRLDAGQMATAAATTGDGACSLHALWGTVIPTSQGNEYYCENPRDKLCYAMPAEVSETVCFFLHFSYKTRLFCKR